MAGGKFSEANLFGMTIRESANDGSDFTNPDADYRRLYLGEDGQLHVKDSSGTVTDIGASSGAVATDSLWDAAGDLAQGTGANTAAKLTAGSTGQVLTSAGAAAANTWKYPPGYEFNHVAFTSPVAISATVEASSNTIVTAGAVTYDGSTIIEVEFFAPYIDPNSTVLKLCLFDGSTSLGWWGLYVVPSGFVPATLVKRLTPSNASHTYSVRGFVNASTANVGAGADGAGVYVPGFIRQTKVA